MKSYLYIDIKWPVFRELNTSSRKDRLVSLPLSRQYSLAWFYTTILEWFGRKIWLSCL